MDDDVVANFMIISNITDENEAIQILFDNEFDLEKAVAAHTVSAAQRTAALSTQPNPDVQAQLDRDAELAQQLQQSDVRGSEASNADRFQPQRVTSPGPRASPFVVEQLGGGGIGGAQPMLHEVAYSGPDTFEVDDDERGRVLSNLFDPPAYVFRGEMAYEAFCRRACSRDRWVLLSIIGDDLKSLSVNRDLWKLDVTKEILCNVADVYQVTTRHPRAATLMTNYHIRSSDIPRLMVINPITESKEVVIDLIFKDGKLNHELILERFSECLLSNGSPFSAQERKKALRQSKMKLAETPAVVVVSDDEQDTAAGTTAEPPAETLPVVQLEPVNIDEHLVSPGPDAFVFRCRLPKELVALHIRPTTPVTLLVKYLSYRTYLSEPTSDGALPQCELKAGFPPRSVIPDDDTTLIGTWGKIRSGETSILHIS